MSNPVERASAFFMHICKESHHKRLSTYEEFETSCNKFPQYEITDEDRFGNTALHIAAKCGNIFLINTIFQKAKELLDQPNEYGVTPLRRAIQCFQTQAAAALLEYGASVTGLVQSDLLNTDTHGNTVLHHAAMQGNAFFINSIFQKAKGLLVGLLDFPNKNGRTPLCKAIEHGVEVAEVFIESGASVTVLAQGDISYWESRLSSEQIALCKKDMCAATQVSLLAFAVDQIKCKPFGEIIPKKGVELLLQYNDSWEDSATLAKQIFLYRGYPSEKDVEVMPVISKYCSDVIKEAEGSIAKKREPIVTLLSDFIPKDTAGLVVKYIYVK